MRHGFVSVGKRQEIVGKALSTKMIGNPLEPTVESTIRVAFLRGLVPPILSRHAMKNDRREFLGPSPISAEAGLLAIMKFSEITSNQSARAVLFRTCG